MNEDKKTVTGHSEALAKDVGELVARDKRRLYTGAVAVISCAKFKAGEAVRVEWDCKNWEGVNYYTCNGEVEYPEHHLTRFII